MAKNKQRRFKEMKLMPHVFEPTMDQIKEKGEDFKGNWNNLFFKNNNPITLELGCGKGEYTVGLAQKYPDRNFIGVDIKGARMWVGAKEVQEKNIKNVAFLRTKVDFIDVFFAPDEIAEIWLTFSDPQPNKPNKRLTSKYFVDRYRKILKTKGPIHLKTDSSVLFESTEEEITTHNYTCNFLMPNLYEEMHQLPKELREILQIKTHYESLFTAKGAVIKYCQFSL